MRKLGAPLVAGGFIGAHETKSGEEQVVKIKRRHLAFFVFVGFVDFGDFFLVGVVNLGGVFGGVVAVVFGAADGVFDVFGFQSFSVEIISFHEALNQGELVLDVVNDEISREFQGGARSAEDFYADTVESAHERHERVGCGGVLVELGVEEKPEARTHFIGGFIGESDG